LFGVVAFVPAMSEDLMQIRAPTGSYLDRELVLSVVPEADTFQICISMRNVGQERITLQNDFSEQVYVDYFDKKTNTNIWPDRNLPPNFIPEHFYVPMPPWLPQSYFELEVRSRLEYCRTERYDAFHYDQIRIQAWFESHLDRTPLAPEGMKPFPFDEKSRGRALFRDEVLYSNVCTLDRIAKQATCS